MTAAPLDRRSIRAMAIVQAGDIVEVRPGIWHVRDTVSGSGQWHLVAGNACGCHDFRRTGQPCKHLIARNAWVAQQTACPTCHGPTKEDLCWCGRSGWLKFRVCIGNREHRATRL